MRPDPSRSLSYSLFVGLPCQTSYWVGTTREQLAAQVARRRHQQAIPSAQAVAFDPALGATAALADHKRRSQWRVR
jgi:hypothetical protein